MAVHITASRFSIGHADIITHFRACHDSHMKMPARAIDDAMLDAAARAQKKPEVLTEVHLLFLCDGGRHRSVAAEQMYRMAMRRAFPSLRLAFLRTKHVCANGHTRNACGNTCPDCFPKTLYSESVISMDRLVDSWKADRERD